jgi:hypothetical protein
VSLAKHPVINDKAGADPQQPIMQGTYKGPVIIHPVAQPPHILDQKNGGRPPAEIRDNKARKIIVILVFILLSFSN